MPKHLSKEPRKPFPIAAKIMVGLVLLIVVFLVTILNFDSPSTRSPVSRVLLDLRTLCTALEAYSLDYHAYPPHAATGAQGINRHLKPTHPAYAQPTFRATAPQGSPATALTTPVAYITAIPHMPSIFQEGGKVNYSYYTTGTTYIVYCPGYDQVYDIDPFTDFTPETLPTSPSLVLKTYDPTNGAKSAGDIWRTNRSGDL